MHARKPHRLTLPARTLWLMGMVVISLLVGGLTYWRLYQSSVRQWGIQLTYLARSHARLIEAVARYNNRYCRNDVPGGAVQTTIMQLKDGYGNFNRFGETGTVDVARREGEQIVYLIRAHDAVNGQRISAPLAGKNAATPMQRALRGESGTMIGLDYAGKPVLAAHEPVKDLGAGIVAKVEMREITGPALQRGVLAGLVTLLLLLLGHTAFRARRRQAESQLQQLTDTLNLALNSSRVGTWSINTAEGTVEWDANLSRIFGLEAKPYRGHVEQTLPLVHEEDRARVRQEISRCMATGEPYAIEYRMYWPDGGIHHIASQGQSCRNEQGEPTRMIGVAMDTTELRRSQESAQELAAAVAQLEEAIVITDAAGTIQYVNPAFERITGYTAAEALGRNSRILKCEEHDASFYRQVWETLRAGRVWLGRVTNRRKDGTHYKGEESISPVRDAQGRVARFVAVLRDATEQLSLEQQLQQAQKMEAVGRLAGGVAHDFNNLMTVILGYTEMLGLALGPESPQQQEIQEVLRASERAVELTRQLLVFARRQIVSPQVIDLNQLIRNVDRMLRRLLGEDIEIVTELEPELGRAKADPGQFEQLLINLAINARDAMPQGGRLTVETGNAVLDEAYARMQADVTPGHYVMLAISDTGHGMTPEVMARIFEPFFTTKEAGRGTGLGLATAYGTVKQAGGHILVQSEVGRGTTFRVYLPVTQAEADRLCEPGKAAELPRGSETILLVEDEPQVRRLAAEILRGLGYRVLEAPNGAAALAQARERDWRIDLLLTDVVLPQLSGRQLAEQVHREAPGVRVLFTSGYAENVIAQHGVLEAGIEFISKPFTPSGLALKVRRALDAETGV